MSDPVKDDRTRNDASKHDNQNSDSKAKVEPALVGEELKKALVNKIETVFTKEYLASDPTLVSKMNSEYWAPISDVIELASIQELTKDEALINQAIRSTDKVVVDEEKKLVRPATPPVTRTTIILRDTPKETTPEQVKGLFSEMSGISNAILEVKEDFGKTFFIKFNDENVTIEALKFLKSQQLGGQAVQARIKSEYLIRELNTSSNKPKVEVGQTTTTTYTPPPYIDYSYEYNRYPKGYHQSGPHYQSHDGHHPSGPRGKPGPNTGKYRGGPGKRKDFSRGPSSTHNSHYPGSEGNNNNTTTPSTRNAQPALVMAPSNWPPLPASNEKRKGKNSGYKGEFIKYQKETIVAVINGVKESNEKSSPNWSSGDVSKCSVVLEQQSVELEVNKALPLPKDSQGEFLDNRRSRARSTSGKQRVRGNSFKQVDHQHNESTTTTTATSVWPTVASSAVKKPPTPAQQQQQKKSQKKPKYQQRTTKGSASNNTNATPATTASTAAATPASSNASSSAPQVEEKQAPAAAPAQSTTTTNAATDVAPAAPASEDKTDSKSNGPSYADIAKNNNSPASSSTEN
eukprot:TRINITY_DN3436_c0_g1_i1.p1 TRINITY_DN3436_c0_g1~~TRINITY_DN3436_c0_g1_i1.p1  ORF type:complete len:573 (+),score=194.00 TRINITY_DN3436_c0_g1_i1:65-1783(+)